MHDEKAGASLLSFSEEGETWERNENSSDEDNDGERQLPQQPVSNQNDTARERR